MLIQRIIPLFAHSIQMVLERGSDQLWQVTLDILFHDQDKLDVKQITFPGSIFAL